MEAARKLSPEARAALAAALAAGGGGGGAGGGGDVPCACCGDIAEAPVAAVPCGHVFCAQCLAGQREGAGERVPCVYVGAGARVVNTSPKRNHHRAEESAGAAGVGWLGQRGWGRGAVCSPTQRFVKVRRRRRREEPQWTDAYFSLAIFVTTTSLTTLHAGVEGELLCPACSRLLRPADLHSAAALAAADPAAFGGLLGGPAPGERGGERGGGCQQPRRGREGRWCVWHGGDRDRRARQRVVGHIGTNMARHANPARRTRA